MKKYQQIYEQYRQDILAGRLLPGQKLPSLRETVRRTGLSQTTVETAYEKLADEGYIQSQPQKGWFVHVDERRLQLLRKLDQKPEPEPACAIDLRPLSIHPSTFELKLWKKYLRNVLDDEQALAVYGSSQGERPLRESLAHYAYKSRRLLASSENIIVGPGFQYLLMILCSLYDTPMTVGMEAGKAAQARYIFQRCGWHVLDLKSDEEGILPEELARPFDILYLTSACQGTRNRPLRQHLERYQSLFLIEDDYNGELTYMSGERDALCARWPGNIYMGSFSRVLVPGLRLAYMVLPDPLMNTFLANKTKYGPGASKFEQLALARYISDGSLMRHIRQLNRLYRKRCEKARRILESHGLACQLNEAYLSFDIFCQDPEAPRKALKQAGIRVQWNGNVAAASFASVKEEELENAFEKLAACMKQRNV